TNAAYSMVFMNRFSIAYPRRPVASAGVFDGRVTESGTVQVSGLGPGSVLIDTTDAVPRWLKPSVTASGLQFAASAGRSYFAPSPPAAPHPAVALPLPADLRSAQLHADYLVIGPREFLSAAVPLLELRTSQGLVAKAVAIEDVYEQFGYGEASPEAL